MVRDVVGNFPTPPKQTRQSSPRALAVCEVQGMTCCPAAKVTQHRPSRNRPAQRESPDHRARLSMPRRFSHFRPMRLPRTSLLLVAALYLQRPLVAHDPGFDSWADDFAAAWVRASPETATSLQYFTGDEQDALDRQLSPVSIAARTARIAQARGGLETLGRFDTTALSPSQRISAAVLHWQLDSIVASEPFADHDFVFHQFRGLHTALVDFLTQRHPIRRTRDIENYLARLALVAPTIDDGIVRARDAATRGFIPPRFILTAALGQIDRFLEGGAEKNALVTSLDERIAALPEIDADARAAFVAQAAGIVSASIEPAYRRVHDMLDEQLRSAGDDAGLWRLPRGDEAYAQALRRYTTTRLTPDEIHEIGLAEVARLEAAMDPLLSQLGFTDGTIEQRFQALETSLQPKEGDPRARLIEDYTRYVRDAERRSADLFDLRPKAPVEVRRVPPMTEKTAAAHYTFPAPDGSTPGIFWAPLPGPTYRMARMRTLAYHEAVPGHHFQIALQQEMTDLPRFRRDRVFGGIAAHAEGWALYAELLAVEHGWYEGDTIGLLGQMHSELFRARRLVVDTGLHARRWTRQQAIDYGILPSEVDRYVVYAGQACSYKIGMLRMLELRERARAALGADFSLKEFHNVILRAGNVPLEVLDQVIAEMIAGRRGA